MIDRHTQTHTQLLASILSKLPGPMPAEMEAFIRQCFAKITPVEMEVLSPEAAAQVAKMGFEFARQRAPGEIKIQVLLPGSRQYRFVSSHVVIQILNDDMPFLVDSIAAELSRQGFTVHELHHPVLYIMRNSKGALQSMATKANAQDVVAESFMHIEISPLPEGLTPEKLAVNLTQILQAVRLAVEDFKPILAKAEEAKNSFSEVSTRFNREEINEARDFLQWLIDKNFIFLGYIEYDFHDERGKPSLQIVPGSEHGIFRLEDLELKPKGLEGLPPEIMHFAFIPQLLEITKASRKSVVHRPVHMDYIGIKRFNAQGKVIGERRLLGLFTSSVYYQSTDSIPIIRQKIAHIMERSGFEPASHDGKALKTILEFFPRDELFQITEDDLYDFSLGILSLEAKPGVRLFVRRDVFERFLSCMVFVPREKFSTYQREQMQRILEVGLSGTVTAFYTQITDSPLARVQLIIKTTPGQIPSVNIREVEEEISRLMYGWDELLMNELIRQHGTGKAEKLFRMFAGNFPKTYVNLYSAESASHDIGKILEAVETGRLSLELYYNKPDDSVHLKLYNPQAQVPLSDILPMLENMGFRVIDENPFLITPTHKGSSHNIWMRDLRLSLPPGVTVDIPDIKLAFEEALSKVWHQEMENDGFNALVLRTGLAWREVMLMRAIGKYMRQTVFPYSQPYMEQALISHPSLVRLLVQYFLTRFGSDKKKGAEDELLLASLNEKLGKVTNLTEDRIIRRYMELILAMTRTNYFQKDAAGNHKPYLSFKFDSARIPELPKPVPYAEIFVYSMRVEAIHLRGGKVARGGLRWSDRGEDFRTEVLGLMKAQMVKNAVIVPVGSKGGFYVKNPLAGDREAIQKEGVECYKIFLRGLLDLTDNIVGGKIVPPENVICHDGDDPYLVVAADKGTATFSDIANSVSKEYAFWLDDAFASGGSAGYDHKKMGITARGGWISVTRHFHEMGVDIASTDFTVAGIGDMAGDVFGNGMLLSDCIRLIGAFNHLHIFLDPNPDSKVSFAERKRLFELSRSSWKDYDTKLISEGGGVYERSAKSIPLNKSVQECLGIKAKALTPDELIKALLSAPVDLLWNGGIGTYVKAESETHDQVGDRANNSVRINGKDLRCKVVGEGGNLGFTQRGRIEYAVGGGRINTDAIDNSAGVDCSDHEVNIKIALNAQMAAGKLTLAKRDVLLRDMTDEVAALVLKDNTLQTQAITIAQLQGPALLEPKSRLIAALEREGLLDRTLEFLPSDKLIGELRSSKRGLTRPEIAILLSYSKMSLYNKLLASTLPDDPYLVHDLLRYFPQPMQKNFKAAIEQHPLRREIIATVATNSTVNRAGITFFHTICEDTGMDAASIIRAYTITRDAFSMRALWGNIEQATVAVNTRTRVDMFAEVGRFIERSTLWFLRNMPQPLDVSLIMQEFVPGIGKVAQSYDAIISEPVRKAYNKKLELFTQAQVPEPLAREIAQLEVMSSACDIVKVASESTLPIPVVGKVYFELGAALRLGWLRQHAGRIAAEGYWERMGVRSLIEDLFDQQRRLTATVIQTLCEDKACEMSVDGWIDQNQAAVKRYLAFLDDLKSNPVIDFSMLVVATRNVKALAEV